MCLLALIHYPSYLIHRLTVSFHASFLCSVAFAQLRLHSLAVVNSREDFHPQDRAHAGRTHPPLPKDRGFQLPQPLNGIDDFGEFLLLTT